MDNINGKEKKVEKTHQKGKAVGRLFDGLGRGGQIQLRKQELGSWEKKIDGELNIY